MNNTVESEAPPAGIPWIQPEIQHKMEWRNGDVVISVPAKSGTTWTMNIVHQLLTGGTSDFRDIYEEVPWIEFLGSPEQTHQDVLDRVNAMQANRRAFKTHSAPPNIPFQSTSSDRDVKYVVVLRNPEEALVSFQHFIDKHTDEWFDLWGMPREAISRPDFPSFYSDVVDANGMQGMFFGFLAAWWPLRNEPNVLFLHFADMKRDHEGSVRKIANFLGAEPGDDQWPAILEYTSFPWMKQHENKFEAITATKVPLLASGAMIRKGEVGKAKSDGMTEDISRHLREVGNQILPDAAAVDWLYNGGEVP